MSDPLTAEEHRLQQNRERNAHWRRWGPYLSERQWGTVREDYSAAGDAWEHFPHEHARSRAYRWGEDGIAGISDNHQRLCFALAFWNERDRFLKERLFGLTGSEGNHAEDVKEYYYYLDATPTHSYLKYLYKYPQAAFPYDELVSENRHRSKNRPEFELIDTTAFTSDRYFDIFVEYAKAAPDDILIRLTAHNRGPEAAPLHLLPTIWFRNTWSWGDEESMPQLRATDEDGDISSVECEHETLGRYRLACDGAPELLFTDNQTNNNRLYGEENEGPLAKDGINDRVVLGREDAVNLAGIGTKAAAWYRLDIPAGESIELRLRLAESMPERPFDDLENIFASRIEEADAFYAKRVPENLGEDGARVQRQAFAGLIWTKQFYHYDVRTWLDGDKGPKPPDGRGEKRNGDWRNFHAEDILSMPDKWEYPWFAAWDTAFHCLPLALIDPDFAKDQLILLLREWYMHPNGQLAAYEWNFSDVNPPVHAWAAWRVYKIEKRIRGVADRGFLERIFHKLLLNFTWWVNRKDSEGKNVFQGGFLGLDNIGVFDRSKPLPTGGRIEQSDATSWMGMFCLNMLAIALELARENRAYADVASKFFEHFMYIAHAMNHMGHEGMELWDKEDNFYYDVIHLPDDSHLKVKIRSMVGLIPLFAVQTLEPELLDELPNFKRRLQWFIDNRPELRHVFCEQETEKGTRLLLSIVGRERLGKILGCVFDEAEFFGPHGIRALSRYHEEHPYSITVDGTEHRVYYQPAESDSYLFGGNSNWRGPVWFPVNYLLIESLQKFHHYFGSEFKVECPAGSGRRIDLWTASKEISQRLSAIFLRDDSGRRPVFGESERFQNDPHWRNHLLFYEYFHGDNGAGVGASHQTGWTALVAKLLEQSGCPHPDELPNKNSVE